MHISAYDGWNTAQRVFTHQTVKYMPAYDDTTKKEGTLEKNSFISEYMLDKGATTRFNAAQFHIHVPSEHTVNGKQHDAEIHFVHYPPAAKSDYSIGTAVGFMFSREAVVDDNVKAATDAFLDAIGTDLETNAIADETAGTADPTNFYAGAKTNFGSTVDNLFKAVDLQNRWYYLGSLTTPACNTKVVHNVLRTIFPIT